MKKILLLALVMPMIAFAQDKQDYVRQVDKFVNFYNKQQTDSICTLFPDERTTKIKCEWKEASNDGTYDIYGKITGYEYIGVDSSSLRKLTVYKVRFSKKGVVNMSVNLSANHKFTVFLLESAR
jgi:hypothetical protein